jgi:adenylate cyclase
MGKQRFIIILLCFLLAGIYLFASAPPKLDQSAAGPSDRRVTVEQFFSLLDAENASIRAMYTAEIVGPGQKNGLKFDENWKKREVDAGPLPALFLRETSSMLQRDVEGLNLFLGSDFPIVSANAFKGLQVDYFKKVREDGKPQFFQDPSTKLYTAMFPDVASAKPCVSCHNDHEKTPKKNWMLNDIMGATTWLYPRKTVPVQDVLQTLAALRRSAVRTYAMYLDKVKRLPAQEQPVIGSQWPKEGHFLPDVETFTRAIAARNSVRTLTMLIDTTVATTK